MRLRSDLTRIVTWVGFACLGAAFLDGAALKSTGSAVPNPATGQVVSFGASGRHAPGPPVFVTHVQIDILMLLAGPGIITLIWWTIARRRSGRAGR